MSVHPSLRTRRRTVARILPLACIVSLAAAGAAQASGPGEPEFSGRLGVATENVAKGLGKSDGEPSVSGGVEAAVAGFYAGFSGSTVALSGGADAELVATIGYVREIGGIEVDASAMHKVHTNTVPGYDDRFMEYQVDVSRDLGAVGATLRLNYTPDGPGAGQDAWWVEGLAGAPLGDRTRVSGSLGRRITDSGVEYTAWNIGARRKLTDALGLDVRWYDTDEHAQGERYESRLVAALNYAF